ncbi:hypothetical protein MTO96_035201 [Rhipicephalus appendiculatus]
MQYLTLLVLKEGQPIRSYQEFASRGRSLEYAGVEGFNRGTDASLQTDVHAPRPAEEGNSSTRTPKYVYVARNPWDCCVSFTTTWQI